MTEREKRCETCEWWEGPFRPAGAHPNEVPVHGLCHAHPPVPAPGLPIRPRTHRSDWCGDWGAVEDEPAMAPLTWPAPCPLCGEEWWTETYLTFPATTTYHITHKPDCPNCKDATDGEDSA